MLSVILSYISGILTLLVLDGIMIWFVILPTFKKYIPTYLNTDMNFVAAIAFYLLYILVLLIEYPEFICINTRIYHDSIISITPL
jgi:uncharacterized membrane protein